MTMNTLNIGTTHYNVYQQPPRRPSAPSGQTMTIASGNKGKSTAIKLTNRDLAMLAELLKTRYMTKPQFQSLFFRNSEGGAWGRLKACERRLRKLCHNRLIRHIEQPVKRGEGRKPYIYTLDKKGAEILVAELGVDLEEIDYKPKAAEENYPFLQHLLATTDFKISLTLACEQHPIMMEAWWGEKELRSEAIEVTITKPNGKSAQIAIVPDACFTLRLGEESGVSFLEIDRCTVPIEPSIWERKSWAKKVQAYMQYYQSRAYQERYGDRPARILTVTTGKGRLENLREATQKAGGTDIFWFSTFESVGDPAKLLTAPIWKIVGNPISRALLA